ncbi:MAG TPA: FliI/YscN family ATPase [Actinomycetota bacterium]|nr:FliI/YscN family ATPase [Actinomycetota bacterium]
MNASAAPVSADDPAARVRALAGRPLFRVYGRVSRIVGHELEIRGLRTRVGDAIAIHSDRGGRLGEIVAVGAEGARALVLGDTTGLGRGDRVSILAEGPLIAVSPGLAGRVLDGTGRPMDGRPLPEDTELVPLHVGVPDPMARQRITEPLPVGVRLIDGLCTVGRGQRVGIFGGSGVGKSTLLGMIARGTAADVAVLALVGERGREVRDFIEDDLGPEGLGRCVVVVATSDEPPLVRLRAAFVATRIAEWFADGGRDVLLMFDSLTRLAMAQRDVGLAAGEPPTARGYTPSVFSLLPRLLERAGPRARGTITGIYTVLVEGDDMENDPIADATRSILDGHLVLSRRLAEAQRYPALDPLSSLSRLAPRVTTSEQRAHAAAVRAALAAVEEVRDMVEVGAYVPGTDPLADRGLAAQAAITEFLKQDVHETAPFEETLARLAALAEMVA